MKPTSPYTIRGRIIQVHHKSGLTTVRTFQRKYDADYFVGVAHKETLILEISALQKENSLLYDVKGILGSKADGKL